MTSKVKEEECSHCYSQPINTSSSTHSSGSTQDEGYHSDHKYRQPDDTTTPLINSTRTIRISYTAVTYILSISIILISLYSLYIDKSSTTINTFPSVFTLYHIIFHLIHLTVHHHGYLKLERLVINYGTSVYWIGYLLSRVLFAEKLNSYSTLTMLLFWALLFERRNAWGIIIWEFICRLDEPNLSNQWNRYSLITYRIWTLFGVASVWGLIYIPIAKADGYPLLYLIQIQHIIKLLLIGSIGGLQMICYWSFWTFQYRGILWQQELRKGIIVWYSEGIARAGNVD
ncbi:hypothetical protein BDB01DRAFT_847814 [Pilobolus umbonatus]|nr:hypothetical protein BDB01DRAFT_847814 [Pilobolus umbonatus]